MTREQLKIELITMICEYHSLSGSYIESLQDEATVLVNIAGDSLGYLELIMVIEEAYDINIPSSTKIITLGNLLDYLQEVVNDK